MNQQPTPDSTELNLVNDIQWSQLTGELIRDLTSTAIAYSAPSVLQKNQAPATEIPVSDYISTTRIITTTQELKTKFFLFFLQNKLFGSP